MSKKFYITGVILGSILNVYLLIFMYMIQSKNENFTAFAVVGTIVPLIAGFGCVIWFVLFISKLLNKKIIFKNYKLPLTLTTIPMLLVLLPFFLFFASKFFIFI